MEFDVRWAAPIATSIACMVSVYLWVLSRRKRLSYRVLLREKLIPLRGAMRRRLQVKFENEDCADAYVVLMKIINNGQMPINPSDYQTPLTVSVAPGCTIISVDLVEAVPANLDEQFQPDKLFELENEHKVKFKNILLNPGEFLTIQMLVRKLSGKIMVSGRLQGVTEIMQTKETNRVMSSCIYVGLIVMCLSMLIVDTETMFHFPGRDPLPCLFLFLIGLVIFLTGEYFPRHSRDLFAMQYKKS